MRNGKRKTSGSSEAGAIKKQGQYVLLNPNCQLLDDSDSEPSNKLIKFFEDAEDSSTSPNESSGSYWSSSSIDSDDYSFHKSDCESIESEKFLKNVWLDSSNDTDYQPDIEDIIVSPGNAILHDAGKYFNNLILYNL